MYVGFAGWPPTGAFHGSVENGPKGLFKYFEERSIVCNCTDDKKINFQGFTQMVAMATSYTL